MTTPYREVKNAQAIRSPEGDKVFVTVAFENGETDVFKLGGKRAARASAAIIETYKTSGLVRVSLRSDAEAARKYAYRSTVGYTRYGVFYQNPTYAVDVI